MSSVSKNTTKPGRNATAPARPRHDRVGVSRTAVTEVSGSAADKYRAPALDKGLDILELLAQHDGGLTRAEIERALARSSSEIYRMLERLVARQYVRRSPEGDRYALSLKLFSLAAWHPPLQRLVSLALPLMHRFSAEAEQSCHLGVYDRGNVLVVAQSNSPAAWGLNVRVGATVSLVDTGSGQVLLAFADAGSRERMLREHVEIDGEHRMDDAALQQVLEEVARQGYRQRESLQSLGVQDISVPILDHRGQAIAVLTTPYIQRIDRHAAPELAQVRERLIGTAQTLSFDG
ncbi:MAG: IclR family transcriptional regulator [Lautropia sp.]|nr:IclR family transcriptional regulator [Lautropia sp.]